MPIPLRADFDASALRSWAKKTKDGPQARRLSFAGGDLRWRHPHRSCEDRRCDAANRSRLGCEVQHQWTGRPDRPQIARATLQAQRHAPGGACGDDRERADPGHSWRRSLARRRSVPMGFRGVSGHCGQADLSRELRTMGYRKLSARPRHHAQAEGAIEKFKKNFPARLDEIAREKGVDPASIEIWFADEARIGQKNKTTRRWAKRGTRPRPQTTSAPLRPTSSAPSVPRRARAQGLSFPSAISRR